MGQKVRCTMFMKMVVALLLKTLQEKGPEMLQALLTYIQQLIDTKEKDGGVACQCPEGLDEDLAQEARDIVAEL